MTDDWDPPLPPDVRDRLRDLVGLETPDQGDPLHVKLVNAVWRTRNSPRGDQLTAVRLVFNWAQKDAGARKAIAKADYDRYIDLNTTAALARAAAEGTKLSRAEAEQRVRAEDEAYRLKLEHLVAEHEEQSLRKFLDTLDGAIESWRTLRADDRATDRHHAQGVGSHA